MTDKTRPALASDGAALADLSTQSGYPMTAEQARDVFEKRLG